MARGRAKLAMGQGLSVWVLEAPDGFGDAGYHSHHAIQITACLSGALSLFTERQDITAPVIAVASNARHRFEAHGLLAFAFVEPESPAGRALSRTLFSGVELIRMDQIALRSAFAPLANTFPDNLSPEDILRIGAAAIDSVVPLESPPLPDPRIQRVIDYATAHLDGPLSLSRASEGVYLSPSRLRHLFVEQTGLPFKTYVLWLRLVRALKVYSTGRSLTEAAHAAGFSDSAHFSRVFKRTFGLPATTLPRV